MLMSKAAADVVLRPLLYRRLLAYFHNDVKIINQGRPLVGNLVDSPHARSGKKLMSEDFGETYVTHCPYCNDSRYRLYVNHRWGYPDEATGTMNWWLIKCFNQEDCLSDHSRRMDFAGKIFVDSQFSNGLVESDRLVKVSPGARPAALSEAVLPGKVSGLDRLIPKHPAREYLESRGFDVTELAEKYDLSYCYENLSDYPLALNRIIIPVYQNQKLVGWQARIIGDPKIKSVPKYYTMPGMRKGQILYNLDEAKKHSYAVLVEGPADVWRYGPEAVAALGCKITQAQQELLTSNFNTVVILLDGDADKSSVDNFNRLRPFLKHTLRISLKVEDDPGSKSREYLRNLVEQTFEKFQIELKENTCTQSQNTPLSR